MKLELRLMTVKDIRFGNQTGLQDGVLTVNYAELQQLLQEDNRLAEVDIDLARPGDSCRILQVADVVEPRAKIKSRFEIPRGFNRGHYATGEGNTCVLKGAAVVMCDRKETGIGTTSMAPRDHIIEMSGPGSETGIYGKTCNLVIIPKAKKRINAVDYQTALKMAGLKAGHYLASVCKHTAPHKIETYELPPLAEIAQGMEGLPKVTYIAQIISLQFEPNPGDPILFGAQAGGILPTILHPNQVLDGAVTSALPGLNVQTYRFQNHPIIKELYRRHGKDLCFTGVIATVAPGNVDEFDRMAQLAASLAKWVIGADGAVLTKTGGGAPELAMARTAQACEALGIKTSIAMLHMGADSRDAKYGASTIFSMPELDAIVSMGFPHDMLSLPAVEKVIGASIVSTEGPPVDGAMQIARSSLYGSLCQYGGSRLTAVRY